MFNFLESHLYPPLLQEPVQPVLFEVVFLKVELLPSLFCRAALLLKRTFVQSPYIVIFEVYFFLQDVVAGKVSFDFF